MSDGAHMIVACAGDYSDQLFVVQDGLPQQGQLLHAAPDRGAVHDGRARQRHHSTILDHQTSAQGPASFFGRPLFFL